MDDDLRAQYRVTARVTVRREGNVVYLIDGSKSVKLTLAEAFAVGTHLRDVCHVSLISCGGVGQVPNPFALDKEEQDENR